MGTHNTYVSTEVAKLLKKLGFDWECYSQFQDIHPLDNTCSGIEDCHPAKNWNAIGNHVSVPTLAVVQKWLLEVKGIFVNATNYRQEGSSNYTMWRWYYHSNDSELSDTGWSFNTYEEALEAGINKCLTILLEEEK